MNIKHIITEEIQKAVSKFSLLTEGLSDIVYHFTYTSNLISILKMNKFATSSNLGSSADALKDKGKHFFFSTQRTKGLSGYGAKHGNVAIVLDGRRLNHNYKGSPTDYWNWSMNSKDYGDNMSRYRDALLSKELEDRIVTNKPYIDNAKSYIKEIHILIQRESDGTYLLTNKELKEIFNNANNIPVYLYIKDIDFRSMNKARAIPVDQVKIPDNDTENLDRSSNALYDFHKLAPIIIFKNDYSGYNDEKEKIEKLLKELCIKLGRENSYESNMQEIMDKVNNYKYMGSVYGDDIYRSLTADIHNKRGNPDPYFRELLRMLIADMRKWNSKDLKEYISKKIKK